VQHDLTPSSFLRQVGKGFFSLNPPGAPHNSILLGPSCMCAVELASEAAPSKSSFGFFSSSSGDDNNAQPKVWVQISYFPVDLAKVAAAVASPPTLGPYAPVAVLPKGILAVSEQAPACARIPDVPCRRGAARRIASRTERSAIASTYTRMQ
jgi:hypothetical protein